MFYYTGVLPVSNKVAKISAKSLKLPFERIHF